MSRASFRLTLVATLLVTCVTAWFSVGYFHIDEYFQVIEWARLKLDPPSVAALPWEHAAQLRSWFLPFVYVAVARVAGVLGVTDLFTLGFLFRLVTGLANLGALTLYLRTTLPWFEAGDVQRLHLRVAAWAGFLPYLFVRTSSESGSMAALTAGWAILHAGALPTGGPRRWTVPSLDEPARLGLAGFLFGVGFEMRFQTALVPLGAIAWLVYATESRARTWRAVAIVTGGGAGALALGALVDRWGYGAWTFPAWHYLRTNLFEGAASLFGSEPPFAYVWMLPANLFFPVVLALIALAIVAWARAPRHPLTWATLPFFVVHNLLAHKEERFLFPIAILATGLVALALQPKQPATDRALDRVAAWGWSRRWSWPGKLLAGWSVAVAMLLALVPIGWNHDVRFARFVHERFGDELHAAVLPEVELYPPAYHPRIWDIEKVDAAEEARRIEAGTSRALLIAPLPSVPSELAARVELVYSELPWPEHLLGLVNAYNAHAGGPLRRLRFLTLYRVSRARD